MKRDLLPAYIVCRQFGRWDEHDVRGFVQASTLDLHEKMEIGNYRRRYRAKAMVGRCVSGG